MSAPHKLLRYNLTERLMHWVAGFSYLYLMLTGMAFYTPHAYWLTTVLGGGPTSRAWHPIAGLLFVASVIWMYFKWRNDMTLTKLDREWDRSIMLYISHQDDKLPPVARFNSGQKQFFWIMFLGGLVMLLTGTVLWFTDYVPWSMRWLRYISVLGHATAFLFTMAGFIVHLYMGIFVVRGGFSSVIRGEVSEGWAHMHHPVWYAQMKEAAAKK